MFKKLSIASIILLVAFVMGLRFANAQQVQKVDYGDKPVIDSDFDGLTDEGELQLYKTDPNKADTDNDGFNDGVEVLSVSDPLDSNSYPGYEKAQVSDNQNQKPDIPYAWYTARASGLVAFLLLYISIFLGLTIRIPLLRKIFSPIYSVNIHCWISLQALLFAFFHSFSLLFDKMFGFTLADLFIPFASNYQSNFFALGILGFYLMIILVVTSYGRKYISQKLWRITHFTNIILYVVVLIHAFYLGTDLKVESFRNFFIYANAFLIFIMLINIELRISDAIKRKLSIRNS